MKFQYLEIRPCVEHDGFTKSFLGVRQYHTGIGDDVHTSTLALEEAETYRRQNRVDSQVFWTIYGQDEEGLATAVGDFVSFDAALEVLNALIAPMAAARDLIRDAGSPDRAADDLDDFINQCTTEERL